MLWTQNSRCAKNLLVCCLILFCVGVPSAIGAENVALYKPCTASDYWKEGDPYWKEGQSWLPSNVTDGVISGSGWNLGDHAKANDPAWVKVDLEKSYQIESIVLWTEPAGGNDRYIDYKLYGSLDDSAYQLLGQGSLVQGTDPWDSIDMYGQSFQYLRFDVVGGTNWANLYEMQVFEVSKSLAIGVMMDIKPGNEFNPVNFGSQGVLPVAIYGTADFDVTQIDLETLMLEGMGLRERGNSGKLGTYGDINGDSIDDLMLHFDMRDLDIEGLDNKFTLNGKLLDGVHLLGSDTVRMVPSDDANGDLTVLTANWDNVGSGGAIPEPATLCLLAVGGVALLSRRRRK